MLCITVMFLCFFIFVVSSMRYFMHLLRFRQWRNSDIIFCCFVCWKHLSFGYDNSRIYVLPLLREWRRQGDLLSLIEATDSPTAKLFQTSSFLSTVAFHRVNIWSLEKSQSQPIDSDLTNICPILLVIPFFHPLWESCHWHFSSFSLPSKFSSSSA